MTAKPFAILFSCASLLAPCHGAAVINWVTTNGDAGYTDGSEATNSPTTTSADADTLIGSFPEVTLAVGQSIQLTGNVVISGNVGNILGNQFRWAFFDAPGTPTTGVGADYVGVWAAASPTPADIRSADGSTGNPFSGSATTIISTASDPDGGNIAFDETITFSLTVTRLDETQITTTATLTDNIDFNVEWPVTASPASPASFTYDSVGFLLGGTIEGTSAAFTEIEVSGVEPESIAITEIVRDPESGDLTLTWTSKPKRLYAIDSTTDLASWPGDIDDSVLGNEDADFTSYPIGGASLGDDVFFRVRDVSP